MLGSSEATPYDLRFRLFDVPVRVSPWFWLAMLMIGGSGDLRSALVFTACGFVSILVHEFGHGLAYKLFGIEPSEIVLYGFGGLCFAYDRPRSTWRRVFISFAGPGAGFLLFGLVFGAAFLIERSASPPAWYGAPMVQLAIRCLLFINLYWGLLNLFPIYPLDGGRITEALLVRWKSEQGQRWTHVISLLTAGLFGLFQISRGDYWMGIWFGIFALMNYQILQALHDDYRFQQGGY